MTSAAPILGLVLAGGRSSRMHRDKATLVYRGRTQLDRVVELLERHVEKTFISVRDGQPADAARTQRPQIVDAVEGDGPLVGIRSALAAHPGTAWLVLACDLPFLSDAALGQLLAAREPQALATAFRSTHDQLPEPLCAIWEPSSAPLLADYAAGGGHCPRKFLIRHHGHIIDARDARALDNINTPEEYATAQSALDSVPADPMQLTIQYFALLREQAGRSEETLETRASTPADLLTELTARYGFTLTRDQLKVAVNGEFADWSRPLATGDAVVFIPPVAGG